MRRIFSIFAAFLISAACFSQTVVILRDDGSLWKDNGKDGAEWAMRIPVGTEFEWKGTTVRKTLVAEKNTPNVEFYPVRYQDKDYFVRTSEAAEITGVRQIAVISSTATLFDKMLPSSFRNACLEQGTLVVSGERKKWMGEIEFAEIFFWDSAAWTVKSRFVQGKNVSVRGEDVRAVRFMERALSLTDDEIKREYASKAVDAASSAGIKSYVQKAYNRIFGIMDESEYEEVSAYQATIDTGDGDKANVRNYPMDGSVVVSLPSGSVVLVSRCTREKSKVGEKEDFWYFVQSLSPETEGWTGGWVFGGFLKK